MGLLRCYRFPELIVFVQHADGFLIAFCLWWIDNFVVRRYIWYTYMEIQWRLEKQQQHFNKKVQKIKNTYISTLIYNTLNIHYGKQINANWLTGHVTLFLLLSVFIHSRENSYLQKNYLGEMCFIYYVQNYLDIQPKR